MTTCTCSPYAKSQCKVHGPFKPEPPTPVSPESSPPECACKDDGYLCEACNAEFYRVVKEQSRPLASSPQSREPERELALALMVVINAAKDTGDATVIRDACTLASRLDSVAAAVIGMPSSGQRSGAGGEGESDKAQRIARLEGELADLRRAYAQMHHDCLDYNARWQRVTDELTESQRQVSALREALERIASEPHRQESAIGGIGVLRDWAR